MDTVLVISSFGTTYPAAMENIEAVESALKKVMPEAKAFRCFTSNMVRKELAKRGTLVDSPAAVLEHAKNSGYENVVIQPTHLLPGREYDKLRELQSAYKEDFTQLLLGKPLLNDTQDVDRMAKVMSEIYPKENDTTVVLFGHGTNHYANTMYPALLGSLNVLGREDMLVGTVEGKPTLEDVISGAKRLGNSNIHLVPFMLVNGDHVRNDMAGSGDLSWKSRLEYQGYHVTCTMTGLGVESKVQALMQDHLKTFLEENHVL